MIICEIPSSVDNEEVDIFLDEEGVDHLLTQLSFLKKGKADHIHLISRAWGRSDLDDKTHNPCSRIVHHLKITLMKRRNAS
jgi:hypothetical protein